MEKPKPTTPEKGSSTWEQLEGFVREHVQHFIQALLEEEVTELLPAVYAGAQYVNGVPRIVKTQQRLAA
jgi:hypothetical protein